MAMCIVVRVTREDGLPLHGKPDPRGERRLELHDGWIGYGEIGGRLRRIDLEHRRLLVMNVGERTFSETPLIAIVTDRHFELRNRCGITSVLVAGGGDAKEFSTTLHEHHMAMVHRPPTREIHTGAQARKEWLRGLVSRWRHVPESNEDIVVGREQEWLTFTTAEGVPLVQYSSSGTKCGPAMLRRFTQFLRYCYPGHPYVLDGIEAGRYLPEQIKFHVTDKGFCASDGVTLEILAAESVQDCPLTMDGYSSADTSETALPIDSVIEMVLRKPPPVKSDMIAQREAEARGFWAEGKSLEATLSYLEMIIESGSAPQALTDSVRANADIRAKRLLRAMQPQNADDARTAIDTLLELQSEASHGNHILMTFEAGARAGLGQVDEAIALLTKAIEMNGNLAGAYKDLGDAYLRKHDAVRAWSCWSAARRLSSDHPMLDQVNTLEKSLRAQHSAFF